MSVPIPNEFRQAAAELIERVSPSLVRRILKLDPWRLEKPATEKSDRWLLSSGFCSPARRSTSVGGSMGLRRFAYESWVSRKIEQND